MTTDIRTIADRLTAEAEQLVLTGTGAARFSTTRGSPCTMFRVGDEYIMLDHVSGARHALQVVATDARRLASHWAGFVAGHAAR
jgi:hypothetical protein